MGLIEKDLIFKNPFNENVKENVFFFFKLKEETISHYQTTKGHLHLGCSLRVIILADDVIEKQNRPNNSYK